ncbi:MAG: histidine--tRNA ligase [Candidatus Anstonellales archaeon]
MQKPTGFRDYSFEETMERKAIIEKIESIFSKYGFIPMEQPSLEKIDILTAKSGEAIKDEIFIIKNEDIGLRFDLTIGMARYIASNRDLIKPIKRYIIGNAWRNEESQRGRYREFLQADIDIIGVKEETAEYEIINCIQECLDEIGIEAKLEINNIAFLESFAKKHGLRNKEQVFRILDKHDKMEYNDWIDALKNANAYEEVKIIIDEYKKKNEEKIAFMSNYDKESSITVSSLINMLNESNIKADINPYLVRGLDYYTGIIFEFKANNLTIAAGGRYDNLLSIYGQADYAVGGSIGVDRVWALKKGQGSNEKKIERRDTLYIATFYDTIKQAFDIARTLRKNGIKVDINLGKRTLSKQLEYASYMGFHYVLIIGKKELEQGKMKLRDMDNGNEKYIALDELIKMLKIKH